MSPAWIRTALVSCVLLGAIASAPAQAAFEASAGYVDEIDDEETWTAHLTWLTDESHPWEITGGYIKARDESSPPLSPSTVYVSIGKRLVHRTGFYFVSGMALTDTGGRDDVLSGPFQFVNGIGWQGERIVVTFRHMSNASTIGRNRGENLLTVGVRF